MNFRSVGSYLTAELRVLLTWQNRFKWLAGVARFLDSRAAHQKRETRMGLACSSLATEHMVRSAES